MSTLGGTALREKYGSPLEVARALLLGKIEPCDQEFVQEACYGAFMLTAAKYQLELENQKKI